MNTWNCGTLREDYSTLKKGKIVFYRKVKTSRPMAAGVCYWIRPQGQDQFYQIAESFAGPQLRDLILPKKDYHGKPMEAPDEIAVKLDKALRLWQSKLPPGSQPFRTPVHRDHIRDNVNV